MAPCLDDYRNAPLERRLAAEHGWTPAFAARAVSELVRFLAVKAEADEPLAPSEPLDAVWHALLLRTLDYRRLCEERLGRFVDHTPLDVPVARQVREMYARTRMLMEERYGKLDKALWPAHATSNCN
jgi:hypothetical protein